jgi:hypothetical protein
VTEQLALHQCFRQCAAVHGDEWLRLAFAGVVQRARDHLFAGTALAGDQHAGAPARHALHQVHHRAHAWPLADQIADPKRARDLGAQYAVLQHDGALLQRLFHLRQQLAVLEWLLDVVVGAQAHRLDSLLGGREGGDHDHLQRLVTPLGCAQYLHARAIGHGQIADHQIEHALALHARDGALHAIHQLDFVTGASHQDAQHLAQTGLVVANQDACAHQAKPARGGALFLLVLIEIANTAA